MHIEVDKFKINQLLIKKADVPVITWVSSKRLSANTTNSLWLQTAWKNRRAFHVSKRWTGSPVIPAVSKIFTRKPRSSIRRTLRAHTCCWRKPWASTSMWLTGSPWAPWHHTVSSSAWIMSAPNGWVSWRSIRWSQARSHPVATWTPVSCIRSAADTDSSSLRRLLTRSIRRSVPVWSTVRMITPWRSPWRIRISWGCTARWCCIICRRSRRESPSAQRLRVYVILWYLEASRRWCVPHSGTAPVPPHYPLHSARPVSTSATIRKRVSNCSSASRSRRTRGYRSPWARSCTALTFRTRTLSVEDSSIRRLAWAPCSRRGYTRSPGPG